MEGKYFANGTAIPAGYYEFDDDGKMIIKHGVYGDYLYIYGVMQKAYQLVEFDGDYYFINDGHKIARDVKLFLTQKFVEGKTFADGSALGIGYYRSEMRSASRF